MILRPVRPQSPIGPPITKRPVGLTRKFLSELLLLVELGGQHRPQHVLDQVGLDEALGVDAVGVLGRDQDLLDLDRPPIAVANRHLGLAVGAQVGDDLPLAHLRQALGELVRERDRQRHQLLGLVGGVAEHHPLVAGAGDVELVLVGGIVAGLIGGVHALGDVRRLFVDRVDHRAGVAVEAVARRCRSRSCAPSRARRAWMST